jgi:predicted TIM-barrel fold metal-dependent hydrolase
MAGFEGGMNAVNCALTTIQPERLLFATDYPYNFSNDPDMTKEYIDNIRKLDLKPEVIDGILGGTAAELLGL